MTDRTTDTQAGKQAGKQADKPAGDGSRTSSAALLAVIVAVVIAFAVRGGDGDSGKQRPVADVDLTKLVASTTKAKLPRAPIDPNPQATTDGQVVHPKRVLPVYAAPGRKPFAKVAPKQMNDTWLPVIDRKDGWTQVLLPSRPNGSIGWLRTAQLVERHTPYVVRVHVGSRRMELVRDGQTVGEWSVAVGAPGTPTPTGRTFLLGSIVDENQSFSPVILPLGTHSDTLDTYGGGPGTVALHGWQDPSVFGQAISHGCVRVPADALEQLRDVPLGTLVLIDQQ